MMVQPNGKILLPQIPPPDLSSEISWIRVNSGAAYATFSSCEIILIKILSRKPWRVKTFENNRILPLISK